MHKRASSTDVERDLQTARRQVTELLMYKAKKAMQIGHKHVYESGNKCGKLLARTLKEQQAMTYVPTITGEEGEKFTLPKQTAQRFREYYSSLYNLQLDPLTQPGIDSYLASSGMPGLMSVAHQELDVPITLEEVQEAVNGARVGKAPGPDGYTVQYYKHLLPILGPYLVKMYNGMGDRSPFPLESLKALTTVIPKEEKDPTLCGSYRPISLLNADFKFFAKFYRLQTTDYQTTATTAFSDSFGPSSCPDMRSTAQYYQGLESNTYS